MKVRYLLLISLLIVGALLIPTVSAEELIDSVFETKTLKWTDSVSNYYRPDSIRVYQIDQWKGLKFVYFKSGVADVSKNTIRSSPYYEKPVTLKIGSDTLGHGTAYYNGLFNSAGDVIGIQLWVEIDDFDTKTYAGRQTIKIIPDSGTLFNGVLVPGAYSGTDTTSTKNIAFYYDGTDAKRLLLGDMIFRTEYYWQNDISVSDNSVALTRVINGSSYSSNFVVTYNGQTVSDYSANNIEIPYYGSGTWTVTNPYGKVFSGALGGSTQPEEPTVLRTGAVTMTDHNGTSIRGFEVTAVNFYTGEEYTFSTDTDVATVSLPMDRTTTIRNPQTGVYEEAPIGYYLFFGYKSGYKMTNEDGVRISVMPEEYTSYHICDIIMRSETGYLTGKHQFQLRSRSDNSILQTGTISAQSATTGDWYNTTVSDGIATLILPYDTSNPISQYAGNYFVYGTSPGYEDSEYATRVTVMPHTTYEIHDIYLTPIGGVPAAGNVTLRIQAFSEYGPGVANAQIFIAGVLGAGSDVWNTYTASSTGYLAVSVPGNSTYDIVASAEGYYDSARRIEVFTEPPGLIEIKLYSSGAPTVEPTTQPTGWPTTQPTTQPTGGIPDDDDGSESFLMQAVRGIGKAFGVGFSTAKLIFGMLLALSIGFATAKHLRGGAAEFGLGLVGGTMLGVLIGLLPVWTLVVLLLIVGLYIGNRYIGGANNG